jgi:AmmeMemoRadiSam system protein B
VILPHHLLVQGFLESFYAKIAAYNYYDEIILISPNHFGYGYNYIQTSDKIEGHNFNFDLEGIKELQKSGVVFNEPKLYAREHGIWTQENYLAKNFPSAKVIPLIIKEKTPQDKLDKLVEAILQLEQEKKQAGQKVLVIGSLDFSHYSSEAASLENDRKTVDWLKKIAEWPAQENDEFKQKMFKEAVDLGVSADKSRETVGADSPESIYVFAQIMKGLGSTRFSLWKRTSTIALVPGTPDASNTSHLFVSFK